MSAVCRLVIPLLATLSVARRAKAALYACACEGWQGRACKYGAQRVQRPSVLTLRHGVKSMRASTCGFRLMHAKSLNPKP